MYIDTKQASWDRAFIDNKSLTIEQVISTLEDGYSPEASQYESVGDIEEISVEENQNQSTIELYSDNGILLWDNKNGISTK